MNEIIFMPSISIHNFHALTNTEGTHGLPVNIIFDADGTLSPKKRQFIATQSGLSHVAFLSTSMIADFRLDCIDDQNTAHSIQEAAIAAVGFLQQQHMLPGRGVAFETPSGICASILSGDRALIDQRITPTAWKPISADQLPSLLHGVSLPAEILSVGIINDSMMIVDDMLLLPVTSPHSLNHACFDALPPLPHRLSGPGHIKGLLLIHLDQSGVDLDITAKLTMRPAITAPSALQLGGWILHWLKRHYQQLPSQISIDLISQQPEPRHCHLVAPLATAQVGGNLLVGGHWSAGQVREFVYPEIAA